MAISKKQRTEIKNMFGGQCAYCGCVLVERFHIDHIEPIYRNWVDKDGSSARPENEREDNYFPACAPCNLEKSVFSVDQFRKNLEHKINVLNTNNGTYRHVKRFGLIKETGVKVIFYFEKFKNMPEPRRET